jgi:hypothetical protein
MTTSTRGQRVIPLAEVARLHGLNLRDPDDRAFARDIRDMLVVDAEPWPFTWTPPLPANMRGDSAPDSLIGPTPRERGWAP